MEWTIQVYRLLVDLNNISYLTIKLRIGIAFAIPNGNRASLDDIDIINLGGEMRNEMIPTVISYSPASGNRERPWGSSLSSNAVAVAYPIYDSGDSDLILEALGDMHNLDFRAPSYLWKNSEEIFENFLINVFDAFLKGMTKRFGDWFPQELRDRLPVDIVVTRPDVRLRMQH